MVNIIPTINQCVSMLTLAIIGQYSPFMCLKMADVVAPGIQ